MAVNYKVIQDGKDFYIKETQTNEVVLILNDMASAQTAALKLNMGAGFDGSTPKFMLKETKS